MTVEDRLADVFVEEFWPTDRKVALSDTVLPEPAGSVAEEDTEPVDPVIFAEPVGAYDGNGLLEGAFDKPELLMAIVLLVLTPKELKLVDEALVTIEALEKTVEEDAEAPELAFVYVLDLPIVDDDEFLPGHVVSCSFEVMINCEGTAIANWTKET